MEIVWDDPLGSRSFEPSFSSGPGISLEVRPLGIFKLQNFRAELDLTDLSSTLIL